MEQRIFCDVRKCLACRNCELACAVEHSRSKDLFQAVYEEDLPVPRKRVEVTPVGNLALSCQHCDPAPCVDACITGAMHYDYDEAGGVLVDTQRCVGCWMCVMACRFGVITPSKFKLALKCDLCPDRADYACVEACPTDALFVGTLEEFKSRLREPVISVAEAEVEVEVEGLP